MNKSKRQNGQGFGIAGHGVWLGWLAALAMCLSMMGGQVHAQSQAEKVTDKAPSGSSKVADAIKDKVVDAKEQMEKEKEAEALKVDLTTPGQTVKTFIEAMDKITGLWDEATINDEDKKKQQNIAIACMWVKGTDYETDRAKAVLAANDLYSVLNRIQDYLSMGMLDDKTYLGNADYIDEGAGKKEITLFPINDGQQDEFEKLLNTTSVPRIVLERNDADEWKFDKGTVERAGSMLKLFTEHDINPKRGPMVTSIAPMIESALPKYLVQGEFLQIKYWQWLLVLILIFIGMVIDLFFRILVKSSSRRLIKRRGMTEDMHETIKYSARPFGLLAAAVFWITALKLTFTIGKDENLAVYVLFSSLRIYIAVIGTLTAWRFVDLIAMFLEAKAKRTSTKFDDVLIPLMRKTFKVFVVAIGIVYAAGALGVSIAPLLASIGIASVGISFAMKDTVENFFGSVAVLLDRPFDVGDWVLIDSAEGIVEQVGFRSTRIRTFYNSQITIPNSNLVRAKVDNYGRRRYRRWKTNLSVQYDTTPDQLIAFTEGVRELVRTHPYTRKDYYEVYCNEFGDSSLDILLYVFFEVPDWNTELRERERLFLDIVRLADALGVSFAFPTRTLHLYNEEKDAIHKPSEAPLSSTERRAEVLGVHAAQRLMKQQTWQKKKPGAVVITGAPTDIKLDDGGNPVVEDEKEDEGKKE
ncbi:mechanosensitive ion channel family protein [Poriferisphaera corsica]|nr:mechanosensitive ion channel family protein [Poriferisphaera corsica]